MALLTMYAWCLTEAVATELGKKGKGIVLAQIDVFDITIDGVDDHLLPFDRDEQYNWPHPDSRQW